MMKEANLKYPLTYTAQNESHLSLIQEKLNGGAINFEDIDVLKEHEKIDRLSVSGLDQAKFEYLIHQYGHQFIHLNLFKNPKINDFTPLESLDKVVSIEMFWNQKADFLWDLKKNKSLEKIVLSDIKRMRNLDAFTNNQTLKYIEFDMGMTGTLAIESLKPLASCRSLEYLSFRLNKLIDQDITPLADIATLRELDFNVNLFQTEQVAWLAAHCSNKVHCKLFEGILKWNVTYHGGPEFPPDTLIVGKRKPILNGIKDKVKIEKYLTEFRHMVEAYRAK